MEREKFGSRMGFILLSAGCAIGIGNVWRFPYIAGMYGGGMFVLFYLFFLVAMGIPVMTMTGVQTCALPISWDAPAGKASSRASQSWKNPDRNGICTDISAWRATIC